MSTRLCASKSRDEVRMLFTGFKIMTQEIVITTNSECVEEWSVFFGIAKCTASDRFQDRTKTRIHRTLSVSTITVMAMEKVCRLTFDCDEHSPLDQPLLQTRSNYPDRLVQ